MDRNCRTSAQRLLCRAPYPPVQRDTENGFRPGVPAHTGAGTGKRPNAKRRRDALRAVSDPIGGRRAAGPITNRKNRPEVRAFRCCTDAADRGMVYPYGRFRRLTVCSFRPLRRTVSVPFCDESFSSADIFGAESDKFRIFPLTLPDIT